LIVGRDACVPEEATSRRGEGALGHGFPVSNRVVCTVLQVPIKRPVDSEFIGSLRALPAHGTAGDLALQGPKTLR
jgi:hypothetical protein